MTDYSFSQVLVWDNLGGSVKVARNARVSVVDPSTGLTAPGLKQDGQPVSWVTSDGDGHVTFTSTLRQVRLVAPRGFWQDVISPDSYAEAVTASVSAASAATSAANSATAAANSAALVGAPAGDAIDARISSGLSPAVRKGDIAINVKDPDYGAKGDGTTDDTAAINNAITTNPGRRIVFPKGTYLINPLGTAPTSGHGGGIKLNQPRTILDLGEATITIAPNSSTHYQIIDVNAADCTIIGGTIIGDSGTHTGTTGEYGHGISIGGAAHRCVVDRTFITKCWGDGVFIWERPQDVELRSVAAEDNRRNNLSIIDAVRPKVLGGRYNNAGLTAFTGPGAGIDLEPDAATTRDVIDAVITGVTLSGNAGQGLWSSSNGRTVSATITDCLAVGNGTRGTSAGFQISGTNNDTRLIGCTAKTTTGKGFYVATDALAASLKDCDAISNTTQGFYIAGDRASLLACRARLNQANGFNIDAAADSTNLVACVGSANSQSGSTAPDFDIYGSNTMVTGCISDAGGQTNKPGYGYVVRTPATSTKIRGSLATGTFGSGTYLNQGTGTSVDLAP